MLDKKRIVIILAFIIGIIIVIIGAYFFINSGREVKLIEYTPEEEISDEQLRQTMVSLYFKKEDELVKEERLIDVRKLLNKPYETILKMLIEGPKDETLKKVIPEGTKINKIEKQEDILVIDLSEEFINNAEGEKEEQLAINAIVNTLTELTEINGIKIKINEEESKSFKNSKIQFNQVFKKESK